MPAKREFKIKRSLIRILLLAAFYLLQPKLYAQSNDSLVFGQVLNTRNNQGIAFVNVGIKGKNLGTVSDENGNFSFSVKGLKSSDTLKISCIGFKSVLIMAGKLKLSEKLLINLTESTVELKQVLIKPRKTWFKEFGNSNKSKAISAGFKENKLGYEIGVLMKNKGKVCRFSSVQCQVATCTYDSIFYRVNIYRRSPDKEFISVLNSPIYIRLSKEQVKETINIPVGEQEIEGDFLISLELIKDLGPGALYFCAGFANANSYFRETSQGNWQKSPAGVSISVQAEVWKAELK